MSPLRKRNSFEEQLRDQLGEPQWKPSEGLWDRIAQNLEEGEGHFEPALREKVGDFMLEPSDAVWEGISKELPQSGRKRGLLFWLIPATSLALMAFLAGYWFRTEEKSINVQQQVAVAGSKSQQSEIQDFKQQPKAKVTDGSNSLPEPSTSRIQENDENTEVAHIEAPLISVHANGRKNKRARQSSVVSSNGDIMTSSLQDEFAATTRQNTNQPAEPKSNLQESKGNTGKLNTGPDQNKPSVTPPAVVEKKPDPIPEVREIPSTTAGKVDSTSGESVYRSNSYESVEAELTNFSIQVFAGVHQSYMFLGSPSGNAYGDVAKSLDLRKHMETPALDFSGGVSLLYHFGKGWWTGLGIGMTSFRQVVNYSVTTANGGINPRANPTGEYLNRTDSIVEGNGFRFENKYSFTEIPLQFGYQFKGDSKTHFSLSGAVSYARLNLVSAYMPDPGCVGVLVVNDVKSFPNFKDQFFITLQPSISWSLSPMIEIGTSVYAKAGLNTFVGNDSWVKQRPVAAGFGVFLRKRL